MLVELRLTRRPVPKNGLFIGVDVDGDVLTYKFVVPPDLNFSSCVEELKVRDTSIVLPKTVISYLDSEDCPLRAYENMRFFDSAISGFEEHSHVLAFDAVSVDDALSALTFSYKDLRGPTTERLRIQLVKAQLDPFTLWSNVKAESPFPEKGFIRSVVKTDGVVVIDCLVGLNVVFDSLSKDLEQLAMAVRQEPAEDIVPVCYPVKSFPNWENEIDTLNMLKGEGGCYVSSLLESSVDSAGDKLTVTYADIDDHTIPRLKINLIRAKKSPFSRE